MDNNDTGPVKKETLPGDEIASHSSTDWRAQITPEFQQKIVKHILRKVLELRSTELGPGGLDGLQQTIETVERKVFYSAKSKDDYMSKIHKKSIALDNNSKTREANFLLSASAQGNQNSQDSASQSMQSQRNEGKSQTTPIASQVKHQLPPHSMQKNIVSAGVQSVSLADRVAYGTNQMDTFVVNAVAESCTISQNSVGYSTVQYVPSNICPDSQKCQERQHAKMVVSQHQQQSQNAQQYIHQPQSQNAQQYIHQPQSQNAQQYIHLQQLQNQLTKHQNFTHNQPSVTHLHINHNPHKQQLQNLAQSNQLQSYQQSAVQASSCLQPNQSTHQQTQRSYVQSSPPDSIQHQNLDSPAQNLRPPVLQQHPQLILRQHPQLQQQNMPQSPLLGESYNMLDTQKQQHQHERERSLMGEQCNNLSRMHQHPQQFLGQQNGISNFQPQQSRAQCNVSGNHRHILQQAKAAEEHQQVNHMSSTVSGLSQQQLVPQLQINSPQLQQQMGLQKKQILQRDVHQRLYASSPLLQLQNANEQQKQLYQLQKMPPDNSSASTNFIPPSRHTSVVGGHEEISQKIKHMKEIYLPHLYSASKFLKSLPQIAKTEDIDNQFKKEKNSVENLIKLLLLFENSCSSGHKIQPVFKEKVLLLEKQISNYCNARNRSQPYGKQGLHPMGDHSAQTQRSQMQLHDNHTNNLMQSWVSSFPVTSMQQTAVALQHDSLPSLSTHMGIQSVQSSSMNTLQPGSNIGLIHGNGSSLFHQSDVGSQHKISSIQDARFNILSRNDKFALQSNIEPMQSNSSGLGNKQMKQQEQQVVRVQKENNQHQLMSQQLIHQQGQQVMQQQWLQYQQPKKLQSVPVFQHQTSQPCQVSDVNELKGKQSMSVKSPTLQQRDIAPQHQAYHQPINSGIPYRISSPQILQASSPQISQYPSPLIDPLSTIPSPSKAGTPLQSANSPLIAPLPSTPLAPSPIPSEHDRQTSGVSSQSNATNGLHEVQSLVIGTPGISASPLLADFSSPERDQGTPSTLICSKSSATEQPIERLINVVKSISQKALNASISDISSVLSLVDRFKGSVGHGSKAFVGDDLPATAKQLWLEDNVLHENERVMTKKMKRHLSATFGDILSSDDSINDTSMCLNILETSDLESEATSSIKRPRCEAIHSLLREIKEINRHLVNTVVDITEDDVNSTATIAGPGEGTIVKCSFSVLGLNPTLEFPTLPVSLLVPENYPNSSPILLDKMPLELSKEVEDILVKAKMSFSLSLRSHSMKLGEMARTWDASARAVIMEYAHQRGGGSFSSRYGLWETCISTS